MQKELQLEKTEYMSKNEKTFEFEHTLAEYMQGISKIACCDIKCLDCTIIQNTIEAKLKINIIYTSEFEGRVKNANFNETVTLPLGDKFLMSDESSYTPICYVSNCSSKATSSRKVSTKFTLCYCVMSTGKDTKQLFSADSDLGIHTKSETLSYTKKTSIPEFRFEKEAEISIQNDSEISEIIYCSANVKNINSICSDGKIDFDFTLDLSVLYEGVTSDNESRYHFTVANAQTQFSDSILNDFATEDCKSYLCIDIQSIEHSVSFDSFGENKVLTLGICYGVSGFMTETIRYEFITDAFSDQYRSTAETQLIELESTQSSVSKSIGVSENLRADVGNLSEILMCHAEILSISPEQTEGKTFALAKCSLKILGLGGTGELLCADKSFNAHIPLPDGTNSIQTQNILVCLENCACSIKSGEVVCDLVFNISGIITSSQSISVVKDLDLDTDSPLTKNKGELIVYYPNESDTLWSIAKKYKVSPDRIASVNGVENSSIQEKATLLIP